MRAPLAALFNTLLTLLRGMGDERAEELLQFFAAACGTYDFPCRMLFQCDHDQRFLPAIEALIVIHRHGAPLSAISQKS
jgi:hypothetical protein